MYSSEQAEVKKGKQTKKSEIRLKDSLLALWAYNSMIKTLAYAESTKFFE